MFLICLAGCYYGQLAPAALALILTVPSRSTRAGTVSPFFKHTPASFTPEWVKNDVEYNLWICFTNNIIPFRIATIVHVWF